MIIEWRPIPSFDCYEVSEYGEVRRCKPGIRGGRVGKLMKPYVREDGYRMYILRRDNRSFHRKAHQLVVGAFIGPCPFFGAEVCHNDGSKDNDHYSNLRWDTSAGNKADMAIHGTRLAMDSHPLAKLSSEKVAEIKALRFDGMMQQAIAEKFGIGQAHVSRILSGARWAPTNSNQRPDLAA